MKSLTRLSPTDQLSIVMPVYNEESCISSVVNGLRDLMSDIEQLSGVRTSLIIVNDGSRDKTGAILDQIAKSDRRILVIHKKNGGHGHSVLLGYREAVTAGSRWVFQVDSDDQFDLKDFHKLWNARVGHKLVLGCRSNRHDPIHRIVISAILRRVLRIVYRCKLQDPNIPFRLFSGPYLKALLEVAPNEPFAPNIFLAVLAALDLRGLPSIPVIHRERSTGNVSIIRWKLLKVCFRSLSELWSFRKGLPQALARLRDLEVSDQSVSTSPRPVNRSQKHIAIAGAGFSGATVARILAESGNYRITVFEERPHVAGNCHTARDEKTQIMLHVYGPHIFHTSREDVWNFVQQFGRMMPYTNRVKAITDRGAYSLPINLLTLNQFFRKTMNPEEAKHFLNSLAVPFKAEPANFEEQALAMVGYELYENFFKGYTLKQWGVHPRELPASILKRLPIRFTYEDNYYESKYQGIPLEGYTSLISNMLSHERIEVLTGERFEANGASDFHHVFYSGPVDTYFQNKYGALSYRTLRFERLEGSGTLQGNPVVNFCSESIPYTRVAEHKLFTPWETHEETVCFREYSSFAKSGDIPFYPMRLASDKERLEKYLECAEQEHNVTFMGRLGTYRYLDMHITIAEAMDAARDFLSEEGNEALVGAREIPAGVEGHEFMPPKTQPPSQQLH